MGAKQYISEDFETLLIQKSFEQLLPEEKTFVLQHVQGQEEYDQLRQLFFQVIELGQEDEDLVPDPKVKQHLDKLFEDKSNNAVPWYRQPLFWSGISGIAALFVFAFFWLNQQENSPQLIADNQFIQKENAIKSERDSMQEDPIPQNNEIQFVSPEANITAEESEVAISIADDIPMIKMQETPPRDNVSEVKDQDFATVTSSDEQLNHPGIFEEKTKVLGIAQYKKGNDVLVAELQSIMKEIQPEKNQKSKTTSQETTTLKKEADTKTATSNILYSGKYFFKITVNEQGKLQDIIILKSPNLGSEWDKKILKQMKKQIGAFQSIEIDGKAVASENIIPVQVDFE
jgi:hypothetical protein